MTTRNATGPRVLLVEDDAGLRKSIRDLLEDEGFVIVGEAEDGATGVAMAREYDPDLVLMDLRMPVLDGIEATRRIKKDIPLAQVIVLTAYDDPALQQGADEVGAYAYLVKGCSPGFMLSIFSQAWNLKAGLEVRARDGRTT